MSVKEFLEICAEKGIILSHTWLPSAGGRFSTTFVKKGLLIQVKNQQIKDLLAINENLENEILFGKHKVI